MSRSALLMLPSRSFIDFGLLFKSLIHYEFIFLYGVMRYSSFILLHVAVQFSQNHLLKMPSFFHCIFLLLVSKIRYPWVLLCAFYHFPLVYSSDFVSVPLYCDYCSFVLQSEVRKINSSRIIFNSQDCFGYSVYQGSLAHSGSLAH